MNMQELEERLINEGCNSSLYAIGSRGVASDVFCLVYNGQKWQIFYTERGHNEPPIYEAYNEEEACEFFFEYIMSMQHEHCVGLLQSESASRTLMLKLNHHGIHSYQNNIPYEVQGALRYRVFVTGKDIVAVKDIFGNLPVRD